MPLGKLRLALMRNEHGVFARLPQFNRSPSISVLRVCEHAQSPVTQDARLPHFFLQEIVWQPANYANHGFAKFFLDFLIRKSVNPVPEEPQEFAVQQISPDVGDMRFSQQVYEPGIKKVRLVVIDAVAKPFKQIAETGTGREEIIDYEIGFGESTPSFDDDPEACIPLSKERKRVPLFFGIRSPILSLVIVPIDPATVEVAPE